jgi:hypothetical protein
LNLEAHVNNSVGKRRQSGKFQPMNRVRLILGLVVLLLILGLGLMVGLGVGRVISAGGRVRSYTTSTLLTQIQGLAQLVTVKYIMEKVVVAEDVKVYGESRVLLVAHGIIKAGVDLSKLKPEDIEISGKKVVLRLPSAVITDAYLDEQKTQVLEHSTGLLRLFNKDLQQDARRQGLDEIRRAARNSGIVEDANERARLQFTIMFRQMGFEEVEFRKP